MSSAGKKLALSDVLFYYLVVYYSLPRKLSKLLAIVTRLKYNDEKENYYDSCRS